MVEHQRPKIIVIVGPTASGKTSLSLKIAQKFNGEVINADSRQVYKRLNIGTEKITKEDMNGIQHHLLDVVDVDTIYTATDFKRDATKAIAEISSRSHLSIIAGGTFFYIDTLLEKITTAPVAPNIKLREELEKLSTDDLFEQLKSKDSERAESIDKENRRRLIRSLEILSELATVPTQKVPSQCPYDVLTIGIITDKKELRDKLRSRAEKSLQSGMIDETKELLASGVTKERLSEIGLQYRIIMEYLDGELTEETLIQKIEEKVWQYAKRQLMWLKRDENIKWFTPDNTDTIFSEVAQFLHN